MADEILTVRVDSSSVGVARRDLAGLNTVLGQSERLLRNVTSVGKQMSKEVTTLQRNTKALRGELEDTTGIFVEQAQAMRQTSALARGVEQFATDARKGVTAAFDAYAKSVEAGKSPGSLLFGAFRDVAKKGYERYEAGQPVMDAKITDISEENLRGIIRLGLGGVSGVVADLIREVVKSPDTVEGEGAAVNRVLQPKGPTFLARTATSAGDALVEYSNSMGDAAKQTEEAFTKAFSGAEEALYQFVTTGEANFSSFVSSLLSDLGKIALHQAVLGPLAGALGGIFQGWGAPAAVGELSSLSVSSSFIPGGVLTNKFARGGYTGDHPRDRIAGIVHGQEYVLNADATQRIGRTQLDALNAGGPLAMSGDARVSGMTGSPALQMLTGTGSSIQVAVQIHGAGQVQSTAPEGYEQFAQDIGHYIDQRFNQLEARSQRQGGMAWRQRNGWN
ncbi:Phage tail length tape-measure protein 1 [plant metagenome]|uniref:Phage tail length tape-measure protein 1 n=1 Tax=plant metagenome TaxID=1297885 RepID=A0A484Q0S9_9ZZZZ